MALTGSVSTSKYDGRYLKLSWTATQNIANNTSTIKWTLSAVGGNSSWYATRNVTVTIDGDTVYTRSGRVEQYTGTISSGSKTLTHNNTTGAKSFTVSVRAAIYTSSVNCTGSKTFTLDTIPRTPDAPTTFTITANTGNYVSLGDTVSMSWSGASGAISGYELQYSRGSSGWKAFKTITSTGTSGSTTDSFTATDISVNGAGCAVQYRIRALNGSLASSWKTSNTLTILGGMDLNVSNSWKTGSVWINVNGTWKRAKKVWIKVNGSWVYSK